MKSDTLKAVGLSVAASLGFWAPALAQAPPDPVNLAATKSRLQSLGCPAMPSGVEATLSDLRAQIRRCIEDPEVSPANRAQLTALELELMRQLAPQSSALTAADLSPVLASLQSQINQLRDNLQSLQQEKQQSDLAYRQKEQEFSRTIAELRSQVASLESRPSAAPGGVAVASAPPAAAPAAEPEPPEEPPKFKPTLTISGSVNMVYGGVTGPSSSLAQNFWSTRVQNANRDFSNTAAEFSPNNVTGAINKAGGLAYAYYRDGQSNQFYPPNGLEPVNNTTALNYAMVSSWTGGKVRFDSLSRGGNLIITDRKDPNYESQNPRTLDRAGYELSVNLKGQPVLPNAGLGALKPNVQQFETVSSSDFKLSNLGSDITFANIPMGERDVQNLLDLANVSRELKLGNKAKDTRDYITRAGDTISNIAFRNGTTAARLLEINPQLPPSTAANAVLSQGTNITVPTVPCVKLCVGVNQVANGGLVQNTAFYDDLLNLSIGEYGSLNPNQRANSRVVAAAQTFIKDLVGTTGDDSPEIEDFNFQRSYTFNNDVKVHFNTSFTGKDLLGVTLRYRNFVPYGERGRFPALNLAYGFGTINDSYVNFDRLYWKIPISQESSIWLGTRYKDYYFLPVRYGTFYPVEQQNYFFASGAGLADYVGSGAGITLNNVVKNFLGGNLSFGGGYIANPIDALNPVSNSFQQKGLIGRDTRFRAPVQIGYVSKDGSVIASLNYIYNRGDTLNGFVGTNLSANPFFYDIDDSSQVGATFAWRFKENMSINFVYNHFTYTSRYNATVFGVPMVEAGDVAKAQSWMASLLVDDLIVENSTMGLAVGQVPSIYYNQSAWGTESKPLAFEAWFNYPISDRVFVQPAFFMVTNHDGYSDGGTDWGSTFRVYLNF